MNNPPAFQMYPHEFLSSLSVQTMSTEEIGAYCLLLFNAWIQKKPCFLPLDDEILRAISRLNEASWIKSREKILKNFSEKNGEIYNKKQLSIFKDMMKYRKSMSDRGKRGGRPKKLEESYSLTSVKPKQSTPSPTPSLTLSLKDLKEYTSLWNEKLGDILPKVKSISEGRGRKLRLRLRSEGFVDSFPDVLAKIKASDFLTGKNDKNWRVSFDWVIENDGNWLKILEGNYDNGKGKRPDAGRTFKSSEGRSGKYANFQKSIEAS